MCRWWHAWTELRCAADLKLYRASKAQTDAHGEAPPPRPPTNPLLLGLSGSQYARLWQRRRQPTPHHTTPRPHSVVAVLPAGAHAQLARVEGACESK
jgi:hypothetical protein